MVAGGSGGGAGGYVRDAKLKLLADVFSRRDVPVRLHGEK